MAFLDGADPETGERWVIEDDPYTHRPSAEVRCDGTLVAMVPDHGRPAVSRRRDGGSTTIQTERGRLYAHRRMNAPHWDSFTPPGERQRILVKPEAWKQRQENGSA